ncbi:hypothetical protein HPB52_022436 [Rhipicephalus sanguineus]|uniref:Nucleosome assembly protein n=1 Tax=Rhipicephalus sanguineus TaxID=34632 RepID=A0A9D4QFH0_RHISA|nr:hypothetical protein HPB52_022436 [Rhipicephalus sanguineus]
MTEPTRELEAGEANDANVEDVEEGKKKKGARLTAEMMEDPKVLAALQSKLGVRVGSSSGYIESLPACVKRRIKALKKLHVECAKVEAQFYMKVYALECM